MRANRALLAAAAVAVLLLIASRTRKNGAFYRWLGRVRLTTTKVHFFIDTIIEMAKNDTLDFRIGQTGGAVANNVTLAAAETEAIVEGL